MLLECFKKYSSEKYRKRKSSLTKLSKRMDRRNRRKMIFKRVDKRKMVNQDVVMMKLM